MLTFIDAAAFDHDFGAIDNPQDDFVRAYQSLMYVALYLPRGFVSHSPIFIVRVKAHGSPTNGKIVFQSLSRFIPLSVLAFVYDRLPRFSFLHKNREVAHAFARKMIADKDSAHARGAGSHDVMSILGR